MESYDREFEEFKDQVGKILDEFTSAVPPPIYEETDCYLSKVVAQLSSMDEDIEEWATRLATDLAKLTD